jgi:asparagine synthase (glutamine-hydrolysing)
LAAQATEINFRLSLPNDYLFKVDMASMKEGLEIRVPLLDEDLITFGLSLPYKFKVRGRTGKRVLRAIAQRRLPSTVAQKPKWGFCIPFDSWVTDDFKTRVKETLTDPSCKLREVFYSKEYEPMINAFCKGQMLPEISRGGLYQRIVVLLSVELALRGHL